MKQEQIKKQKREYHAPKAKLIKFSRESTTVLGNCTHWKGSNSPSPGNA